MAKKTVASLQKGEGRTYSKVIIMEKSPKTGAYIFKEEMVPNDAVQAALTFSFAGHVCHVFNKETGVNLEA
ncbi:MAG: DUF4295 domain-containing protein [Muribaculaceae bacterium]|nr:DUF4295 domain-containing protein [Muribaculaceae bacterium]